MILPELKYTGGKLRVGTDLRRTTSKKISFNIETWNVRTL
jgi:hypothetical protein